MTQGRPEPAHQWVDTDAGFADVLAALRHVDAYAVDTEFHRERTYFARLALLQIAWGPADDDGRAEHVVLVDPLAIDIAPMAEVLTGPGEVVMHAAGQDLEILYRICGVKPARLFDTQIAAGLAGYATPSLSTLTSGILGLPLPKADRLTDWMRRPLAVDQARYAASDVSHLLTIRDRLCADLERRGRLEWARDECQQALDKARVSADPEQAWLRLKELRQLRGSGRAVAQAVAAWRERRAATLDVPVRQVLSDLALIGLASRPPSTITELEQVRGVDGRLRGAVAQDLLAAVEVGRHADPPPSESRRERDLERELRPAIALVSAWLAQLSKDLEIDATMLYTRADLLSFLAGDPDSRLAEGWRAEALGKPIADLVGGRASLALVGGSLKLEPRDG